MFTFLFYILEKENIQKEEQQEPAKEETKKAELKKPELKKTEHPVKDKKKNKEKKQEKKKKKKEKKEKKDLEKKLKKEAKKKAAAEALEKLNKTTLAAVSTATEGVKQPLSKTDEKESAVESSNFSASKRKRSPSSERKASDEDKSLEIAAKRTVIEGKVKNKTFTITKTIHNDHHKQKSVDDGSDDDDQVRKKDSGEGKIKQKSNKKKKVENFTITTTQEVRSKSEDKVENSDGDDKTQSPVGGVDANDACLEESDHEVHEDVIEEEVIEEEEEEIEEEIEEEEEIEMEDKIEKPKSRILKENDIKKPKGTSIMERLGPRSKKADSKEEEEDLEQEKRVVNLLEESSFPPRRTASKVTASVPPSKRLEARVRPLSVIERTDRTASSTADRSLSSVVARDSDDSRDYDVAPTLSSKIEVTSSGRDRRANGTGAVRSRAANSALIKRAMADAHKSVTTSSVKRKHSSDEFPSKQSSEKRPKMEVFSKSYRAREEKRLGGHKDKLHKLSITVPNEPHSSDEEMEEHEYNIHRSGINPVAPLSKR